MTKKVLIVDDDLEMLSSLREGLDRYRQDFSVVTAGNGLIAVEKLKKDSFSLVITDLKMPRMDGFSLLSHVITNYPDIPVIVVTGFGSADTEKMVKKEGAIACIEKPFMLEDLARKITGALKKETEGGTLHSISSGTFLQLIEMEEKTCTIRLTDKTTGRQGVLFFRGGELLEARTSGMQGEEAALEIFSWDEVNLSIQNDCALKEKKFQNDLQAILLEAMRLKDEAGLLSESEQFVSDESELVGETENAAEWRTPEGIRIRLSNAIGERCGLEDVYRQDRWDGLLAQMARVGGLFDSGRLKLVYMDRGESNDFILLPGKSTLVLSVSPKCPRDRIMQVLTDR